MSNLQVPKPTVEDRIKAKVKDELQVGDLVSDEELMELTRQAIKEALFQRRREKTGWHDEERDSPIVAAARELAHRLGEEVLTELNAKMVNDPEVRAALLDVFVASFPNVIRASYEHAQNEMQVQTLNLFREKLERAGLLQPGQVL